MYLVKDLTQDLYFYENAQANGELWHGLQSIKGVSEGEMIRFGIKRQEPLKLELTAFVKAIENDSHAPADGKDGIASLEASLAMVESGILHRQVYE